MLSRLLQAHGFDFGRFLLLLENNENMREENMRLQQELGNATGLIRAIQNKIDELNRSLGVPDSEIADPE